MLTQATAKVFIHIDMDCYYAQAERKRLNLDPAKPICARQWNSLLAVNYVARDAGIKRGMLAEEAQKLCPDVLLPHVDTFRVVDGKVKFSTLEDKFKPHFQFEEKVSLEYYRIESKSFFNILRNHFKCIEKGGCDEAYIELNSDEIDDLNSKFEPTLSGIIMADTGQQYTLEDLTEEDKTLFRASQLVQQIRDEIKKETTVSNYLVKRQYECSAGISFNKMLAKLGSGANKPNKQTLVLQRCLPECLRSFKINKIRGFGGKIKQAFQKFAIESIGQAQDICQEELHSIFDGDLEMADYVHKKIRGYDDETLKASVDLKNKSILSLKNVKRVEKDKKHLLDPILELLIYDLTMRVTDYFDDTASVPTVISVIYHNVFNGQHSKSDQIILQPPADTFRQTIEDSVKQIMLKLDDQTLYPFIHFGLGARSFVPIKENLPQFKFTLKQYATKKSSDSKEKTMEQVDQLANPEKYMECPKCNQTIKVADQDSHNDYHFALNVDQEMNPNRKRYKQQSIKLDKISPQTKPITENRHVQVQTTPVKSLTLLDFFKKKQ